MKTNNNINNLFSTYNIKETIINNNYKNNSNSNNIESFKVYVRIRPFLPKDLNIPKNNNNSNLLKSISPKNCYKINISDKMLKIENNILYLEDIKTHKNKNNKLFVFDNIFNESSNNEEVFNESIKTMIDKILEGYNSTALAYGVTGTGKTYTIFGDLSNNFKEEGIIFKACDYLFEKIQMYKNENNDNNINYYIKISYIEIYNEIVKDLINENSTSLIIVEDPQKGVICPNAKEIIINDSIELKKIINESNKRRTMASTNQNQFSSRSHAILQMTLEKRVKKAEDNYELYFSKFLVVDLAGSERGMERGRRREEGVNINKSLFTLGTCLNILSEKSNTGKFVPYRDSKLTRLLKDSLGGNILNVMLACISQ
jgi:kinesin family protein 18/19